ncbi:hypothetical protein BDZ89DRAFT_695706 [Hymenopellis radicata]|nr:hypothetical protein BDZ89DRAFT_695706 [Hymenopellis radicata]
MSRRSASTQLVLAVGTRHPFFFVRHAGYTGSRTFVVPPVIPILFRSIHDAFGRGNY